MDRKVWFGTRERSVWVPAPAINPDATSTGWQGESTFLNGGAHVRRSWGSHKRYNLSWNLQHQEDIMPVMDCANGMFGTGLVYYADPFSFYTNVLPKDWSTPYLGALDGVVVNGLTRPTQVLSGASAESGLPVYGASYGSVTDANAKKVWVPVPPGYQAQIKAYGSGTGANFKIDRNGTVTDVPWTGVGSAPTAPMMVYSDEVNGGFDFYLGGTGGSCTAVAVQVKVFKDFSGGAIMRPPVLTNHMPNPSGEGGTSSVIDSPGNTTTAGVNTPLVVNHAMNPSFETAGSEITVTNLAINPMGAVSGRSYFANNGTLTDIRYGVPTPGDFPWGATTCASSEIRKISPDNWEFTSDTSGWSAVNGTLTWSASGYAFLNGNGSASSAQIVAAAPTANAAPNVTYTMTARALRNAAVPTNARLRFDIIWYDAAGAVISTSFGSGTYHNMSQSFQTFTQDFTSPANTARAQLRILVVSDTGATLVLPSGATVWFDHITAYRPQNTVASMYNADGLLNNSGIDRRVVTWVYVNAEGYRATFDTLGASPSIVTDIPANTWTRLTSNGVIAGNAHVVLGVTKTGLADPADKVYVTGTTVISTTVLAPEPIWGGRVSDEDQRFAWTGASDTTTSTMKYNITSSHNTATTISWSRLSSKWSRTGSKSLFMQPSYYVSGTGYSEIANHASSLSLTGLERGETYTAIVYMNVVKPFAVDNSLCRSLAVVGTEGNAYNASAQAPNEVGIHKVSLTFTVPPTGTWYFRIYHNGASNEPGFYADDLFIVRGAWGYSGDYKDGNTPGWGWAGTPNNSRSGPVGAVNGGSHFRTTTTSTSTQLYFCEFSLSGQSPKSGTFSGWVRPQSDSYWQVWAYYYQGGTLIDSSQRGGTVKLAAGEWTQLVLEDINLVGNSDRVRFFLFRVQANGQVAPPIGEEMFDTDSLMYNSGSEPLAYFDGNTPGFSWAGTAHASVSSGSYALQPVEWKFMQGQGTSGMRFNGRPNLTQYSAAMDRVGLSCDLVEVGAWL